MPKRYIVNLPITGGLKQGTSVDAGDGFLTLQNISRYRRNAARRRPGLSTRLEAGGIMMSALRQGSTDYLIHLTDTGVLTRTATTYGSVASTVTSGLASSTYGVFAHMDSQLFFANGSDSPQYIDSSNTAAAVGITPPSAAPGSPTVATTGSISAGDHIVRYRYYSSSLRYWSDPSPTLTISSSDSDSWSFSKATTGSGADLIESDDSRVDFIQLEGTKANGSVIFAMAQVSTASTVTFANSDQELVTEEYLLESPQSAREDEGNGVPPVLKWLTAHRNRLFGTSGNYLYWSNYGQPQGWSSLTQARKVFNGSDDELSGLVSIDSDLYVFARRRCWRFPYTRGPGEDGVLDEIPTRIGLWHQRLLIQVGGVTYGWGPAGIWRMSVMAPKLIDDDVQDIVHDADYDYIDQFHVVEDQEEEVILWFYVGEGETTPESCVVYDYRNEEWRTNDYGMAVTASTLLVRSNGRSRAYITTEHDHTWRLERDVVDGVISGQNSVITSSASSATTTLLTTEAIQTTQTLEGVYLYRLSSGVLKRITASSSQKITIASVYCTDIIAGEEFWIGRIAMQWEPKWLSAQEPENKLVITKATLKQVPDTTTTATWQWRTYGDYNQESNTFTKGPSHEPNEGLGVTDGQNYSEPAMDQPSVQIGYQVSNWKRVVKVRVDQVQPDCTPELTGLVLRVEEEFAGDE